MLKPGTTRPLTKAVGVLVIAAVVIALTPLGDKIVNLLPFIGGSTQDSSVIYRNQLLDRAVQVIQENPFLGDQNALLRMQDLRQGEGIIDVINTYVDVLLSNGFVGLSLFLGFILIALFKSFATYKRITPVDRDAGMLGTSLVSCILGTLIMMADGSFGNGLERLFYVLAGLAAAYSHLFRSRLLVPLDRPSVTGQAS
jgi:O-antigen ligase